MSSISSTSGSFHSWSGHSDLSPPVTPTPVDTTPSGGDGLDPWATNAGDGVEVAAFGIGDYLIGKAADIILDAVIHASQWGGELEAAGHPSNGNAEGS